MKFLLIILFCTTSLFAQPAKHAHPDKKRLQNQTYFEKIKQQAVFTSECERELRAAQVKTFGKVLPKIAGECEWGNNGCPVSLVQPKFPAAAKQFKTSGSIEVVIIVNETGEAVYSKAIKGHKIFFAAAERAALKSRFHPLTMCGKQLLQKRIIRYNFISK